METTSEPAHQRPCHQRTSALAYSSRNVARPDGAKRRTLMNESDACFMSAADLVASYQAKALSPVEVTEAVLARIDRLNPVLNAFVLVDKEGALASARAADWSAWAASSRA